MNKWFELLIGLILVIGAIVVSFLTLGLKTWDFGSPAWEFLKGGLIWFIGLIGVLFILLGISDLKG